MPRKNSSTRAVNDTVTAARLQDINEDIDDIYLNGPDRLRVSVAISGTALRIDISAGAYYIGSTSGVYSGGTDIVVTNSVTNYVMIDNAGTITISTSARTAGLGRLAQVVCSGGVVTSIILRNNMVFGGTALDINALTEDTAPDEENDFLLSLDVSAGVNKKVKMNTIAVRPFIETIAGESITAGQAVRYANAGAGQTITQNTKDVDYFCEYDTVNAGVAQGFTVTTAGFLTNILVSLRKQGAPTGNVAFDLYSNTGTTLIASTTTVLATNSIAAVATDYNFAFNSIYLLPGVYYFRVFHTGTISTTNYFFCAAKSTDAYAGGSMYTVNPSNVRTNVSSRDLYFITTITASTETSGRVYKTNATQSRNIGFLGFARKTVTAGNALQIDTSLSIFQSGLTILSDYYLSNTAGAISTTPGTNSKKIGKALSATDFVIEYNPA